MNVKSIALIGISILFLQSQFSNAQSLTDLANTLKKYGLVEKNTKAQMSLAEKLIKGQGTPKNIIDGQLLLEPAARSDDSAKLMLANMLVAGTDLNKDVNRGITLLNELASKDNKTALNALAGIYLDDKVAAPDAAKATSYLQKAMALGDMSAQTKMASALIKGQILTKNQSGGQALLETAAPKFVGAKIALGNFLIAGIDLPRDVTRGLTLLEEAAATKNASAYNSLATVYLDGIAVPADPVKARSYLNSALAMGDQAAEIKLATSLIKGQGLPKNREIGLSYLLDAAKKNVGAKVTLASLLIAGVDLPKDVTRGIVLLEEAAATNHSGALSALASVYLDGIAAPADPAKARSLLDRAIALGDVSSQIKLANALIKGTGQTKNTEQGLALLEQVIPKNVGAKVSLANFLIAGADLPKDVTRGIALLEEAAATNHTGALSTLASVYLDGIATPADPAKARSLLDRAIALGDINAKVKLANALIKGQGLQRDSKQGILLLEEAAKTNQPAKLTYGRYLLAGEFVSPNIQLASKLLNEVSEAGNPSGWDALGSYYLYKSKDKNRSSLAINYLTKAGTAGNGASWATLAAGVAGKKIQGSKFNFDYYAKKARAYPNTQIEVTAATRHFWGNGVQKSRITALRILESGASNGNVPAMRNLIQIYRNGLPRTINKNLKIANTYLEKFKPKLTTDQITVENFLLRIAAAATLADYQKQLTAPENQILFKRPDIQNLIFAANQKFMIYRAQAGLKRGGIYKGALTGQATRETFKAMNTGCKILANCGIAKLTAENLFHLANRW